MREYRMSRLDITTTDGRILLEGERSTAVTESAAKASPESFVPSENTTTIESGTSVKAPLVGRVYLSPKPGDPTFVKVGDRVNEGDVLCTVEAMKMFNEITAPHGGIVASVAVKNGQAVGYGEKLFTIDRED